MAGDAVEHRLEVVAGANHVFNTPNPFPVNGEPSPQLRALVEAMRPFGDEVLAR